MIHSLPNKSISATIYSISTLVKFFFKFSFLKKLVSILILSCGIGTFLFAQTSSSTLTTSGTFTVPAGVTSIKVECWGGGGAGGGHQEDKFLGGGGGAGGAYASKVIAVTPGTVYNYTVAGVKAGNTSGNIQNGDPTWFSTMTTVFAQGGAGGSLPNKGIAPGGTGSSTSSIGDIKYAGGNGASGTTTIGGAGGGGAGSTGIGGGASGIVSGTGSNIGGGNGGTGKTVEGDGIAGITCGGGGGGAYIPDDTNHPGGSGAAGQIVISWGGNFYKSKASGDWNAIGTWQVSPDNATWIDATAVPTNAALGIQIMSAHTVTVSTTATASSLLVDGSLIITGSNTLTPDNATINGTVTVQNTASFIKGTGPITFNNNSTYNHNEDGGTIPTATWNPTSTCLITGATSTTGLISGYSQAFGNFTWSCPYQSTYIAIGATGGSNTTMSIKGDLTVDNTGGRGTPVSDFAINQAVLNIGGSLIINSSGVYRVCYDLTTVQTVAGNIVINGGQLLMNSSDTGTNMTGTLNVVGNFTFTGGTINSRANSTTPISNIVFNGSGVPQLYTSGGSITSTANSNTINFIVASPAFLQMAKGASPGVISSTNLVNTIFNLSSGATLGVSSPVGITDSGSSGNIQTNTRNFNTAANYTYNGATTQNIGTGFPNNLTGKLTIDDAGFAVTLDIARTIANGGSVNLVAGTFASASILTMTSTSTINRSEGSMTGTPAGGGTYNVNYTGNSKTTGIELNGTGLNNVSVNLAAAGILLLDQNRTPKGDVTISTGSTLNLKDYALNRFSVGGNLTVAGSLLVGGTTGGQAGSNFPSNYSTMTMAGGTVNYNNAVSAQIIYAVPSFYNNLTITNTAGVTLNANTTVSGTLLETGTSKITIAPGLCLTANKITNTTSNQIYIHASTATGGGANGSLIFHNTEPVYGTVEMNSIASWDLTNIVPGGKYKWQFFGIPLKSLLTASPTFDGAYVRKMHEDKTTGHWEQLNNASGLTSFIGYEITQAAKKTYIFQGQLENSDYPVTTLPFTTNGASYPGQSLIGNPYTAAIDISKLIFTGSVDNTVYIYNTGSLLDWTNAGSGNANSITNTYTLGQYTSIPVNQAGYAGLLVQIPSMQAFLVKASSAGSTISIPYSSVGVIVPNTATQRTKGMLTKAASDKIWTVIDVKGSRFSDRMWLFTEPDCTHSFDNGWDGEKFLGSSLAPQLYAMEADGDYQVNSVDDINNTYLGFQAGEDSLYTLTFTHQNLGLKYGNVYLVDSVAQQTVDITSDSSKYTFRSLAADTIVRRFKIITNPDITTHVTTPTSGSTQLNVFSSNHSVYIENTSDEKGILYLYDMTGRLIQNYNFTAQGKTTIQTNVSPATYLVKAITKTRSFAKNITLE